MSTKIFTIYKATNIVTGKVYIGFDSAWPARIASHRRDFKKQKTHFYSAIKKYGWDSFVWEAIYQAKERESATKTHTFTIMENYFIEQYDSISNGYNMVPGGHGGSLAGTKNPMYGKKHKPESKLKISKASIGRNKGKTYEQMYGLEKAAHLKYVRSEKFKEIRIINSVKGQRNPNYDSALYKFYNVETQQIIVSTRYEFMNLQNIKGERMHAIVKKGATHKNWRLL
jgi:group I intron endonuclease